MTPGLSNVYGGRTRKKKCEDGTWDAQKKQQKRRNKSPVWHGLDHCAGWDLYDLHHLTHICLTD